MTATFNDNEVLLKIYSGQNLNEAVRQLYHAHYERLESFILRNYGTAEDAQDIIQETMITFINIVKEGKFRGESGIYTFLQSISKNLWFGKLRKLKSEQKRVENWYTKVKEKGVNLEEEIQYKEATDIVSKIFLDLEDNCQKVLRLFYFDELSMKEILPHTKFESEQVLRNKKSKCMKSLIKRLQSNPEWAETLKGALQKLSAE